MVIVADGLQDIDQLPRAEVVYRTCDKNAAAAAATAAVVAVRFEESKRRTSASGSGRQHKNQNEFWNAGPTQLDGFSLARLPLLKNKDRKTGGQEGPKDRKKN